MRRPPARRLLLVAALLTSAACAPCGGPTRPPTEIQLGETSLIVVVNPRINDDSDAVLPLPGPQREGVTVYIDGGPAVVTDAHGVAVLGEVAAGQVEVRFSNASGTLPLTLVNEELREVAVAVDGERVELLADLDYPLHAEVVTVTPQMTLTKVNTALNGSDRIVLFEGGTYTGNIDFSGSNVTLFGASEAGGGVTLDGNVSVNGSFNRIRGANVTGTLALDGSGSAVSFSRVEQGLSSNGSDIVLLVNTLCGTSFLTGGNLTLLENVGLTPIGEEPSSCL